MADEQTAPAEPIPAPVETPPTETAIVLLDTIERNGQWFPQGKCMRVPAAEAAALLPAKARLAADFDLRVANLT